MSEERPLPVELGMHVEVELIAEDGSVEPMAFDVVAEGAAAIEAGLLAVSAPLVQALRGKPAGSLVAYQRGDIRRVRVLRVRPSQQPADAAAAERLRAAVEEARRKAERTNADMFASSFSGKWGDYSTDEMQE